jgi:hypothetical protein
MSNAYAVTRNTEGNATVARNVTVFKLRSPPAITVAALQIITTCTARQFLHQLLSMNACHMMLHTGIAKASTANRFHSGSHWGMSTVVRIDVPNQAIPITLRLYPNTFPADDSVTVLQLPEHSFTADFQL